MPSPLDLINRIRAARGRSALEHLAFDEDCIVERALTLEVGDSTNGSGEWVVRVGDAPSARLVAYAVGQPWRAHPCEVLLPDELVDLAVSQHFGTVEATEAGTVRGWWIPDEDGMPLFVTPAG